MMNRSRFQRPHWWRLDASRRSTRQAAAVLICVLVASINACKVKLISDYDELIDHSTTELQKKVESFVHKMENSAGTPNGMYDANKDVYDDFLTDVSSLRVRALAASNNTLTVQEIDLIEKNIKQLRDLHANSADKSLRRAIAEPALSALNVQFVSLLKLELAKKRGE